MVCNNKHSLLLLPDRQVESTGTTSNHHPKTISVSSLNFAGQIGEWQFPIARFIITSLSAETLCASMLFKVSGLWIPVNLYSHGRPWEK